MESGRPDSRFLGLPCNPELLEEYKDRNRKDVTEIPVEPLLFLLGFTKKAELHLEQSTSQRYSF